MTRKPYYRELLIPQRGTLRQRWRFPFDGNELEIYASVYESDKRREKFFDIDIEWIERNEVLESGLSSCTFELVVPSGVTKTITRNGYWDLLVAWNGGDDEHFFHGPAILDRNVTERP